MATPTLQFESQVTPIHSLNAEPRQLRSSERLQEHHYAEISHEYEAHYSDQSSLEYRRRFIYAPMFDGIDLRGMKVLDAMCGSGQMTHYLNSAEAKVTGLDISPVVINSFAERWSQCDAVCRSLLDSGLPDESFDCVAIVGGLHHIQPHVREAINEIHRVLKPNGYFCFMEPHSGSLPDLVRRFWYKHDRFFSENEAAIDVEALENEFAPHFAFNKVEYFGNVAFLFVLNSLILRIPLQLKPFYAPALMPLEGIIGNLQGPLTSCFVVGQWQKKPASGGTSENGEYAAP